MCFLFFTGESFLISNLFLECVEILGKTNQETILFKQNPSDRKIPCSSLKEYVLLLVLKIHYGSWPR